MNATHVGVFHGDVFGFDGIDLDLGLGRLGYVFGELLRDAETVRQEEGAKRREEERKRAKVTSYFQDPTPRTEGQADLLQIVLRQFGKIG